MFRENANRRYVTGKADEQDLFQADVEIDRARARQLMLERMRPVAVARINTLLNRAPGRALPPPPSTLAVSRGLPDVEALQAAAVKARPELQALANRLAADQAALALAYKDFYPDFQPFAMYDRFMGNNTQTLPLAFMVGVEVNLPVRRDKRQAAVQEAQAKIAQRRAELAKEINTIAFEVQQAYEQVKESESVVRLYEKTTLKAAEKSMLPLSSCQPDRGRAQPHRRARPLLRSGRGLSSSLGHPGTCQRRRGFTGSAASIAAGLSVAVRILRRASQLPTQSPQR